MTWQNVISRLTYKKGYRFEVDDSRGGFPLLRIFVDTEDTYNLGRPLTIQHVSSLPPADRIDEAGMIQYIRHAIHNTEIHESDEWIRVDGVMLFDPHAGGKL